MAVNENNQSFERLTVNDRNNNARRHKNAYSGEK